MGYRLEVPTTLSGLNNLLQWLMELRETCYLLDDQFIERTELRARQLEARSRARCIEAAQSFPAL